MCWSIIHVPEYLQVGALWKPHACFTHRDVCQCIDAQSTLNPYSLDSMFLAPPTNCFTHRCRSILHEVKDMWPELAARIHSLKAACPSSCARQACQAGP